MAATLLETLKGLPPELATLLAAMLPIAELRGAIPWAVLVLGMPLWKAYLLAVVGNLVPIVPLLLVFQPVSRWLHRFGLWQRFYQWLERRTRARGEVVEKYEALGLMAFVAIPLPVTGAWTGAFAALLFGIRFRRALVAILGGVLIAGAIVSALVALGWLGGLIVGVVLLGGALRSLYNRI